ncbi:MAG: DUF1592 domain-containing protein [Planctomycetota bacterium]
MIAVHASLCCALGGSAPAAPNAQGLDEWRQLVTLTCVDCHGGARAEGGVDLARALAAPEAHVELWTQALANVEGGVMPPEGALEPADRREFRTGLLAALAVDTNDPGRPTLRRLSRGQLANTLRDLFGVSVPVEHYLPEDAAGYGFDTTGDTLFVTPLTFEQWFEVVDATLEAVRADPVAYARLVPDVVDRESTRARLSALLERTFRRPPSDAEVDLRVALVRSELTQGAREPEAFLAAVRASLLAPSFLYRVERDHPEATAPWPLEDHELAVRLAYFLWGAPPDDTLRAAAGAGELHATLEQHVERMLADPRSRWLATDFAAQWLGFSELAHVTPDVRRFSEFNEGLRRSMRAEAEAFFDDLVHADRSVLECLDSDYAFLDARLARHYGIAGVDHDDVRRVALTDRRRGGVLGMAAVLTVTSQPLRTSPVTRGRWLLERLFAAPPPPPPPNVTQLPEDDRGGDGLTLRARLERHRADPSCAACHARMDPYGLALEPYDGIGRWRNEVEGAPIDAAVTLPGAQAVDGPVALKAHLRARPERFVRGLTEHLFVYAIGRPPDLADRPGLDALIEAAAREDYRFSALIRGITRLRAFTHRRNPRPTEAQAGEVSRGPGDGPLPR